MGESWGEEEEVDSHPPHPPHPHPAHLHHPAHPTDPTHPPHPSSQQGFLSQSFSPLRAQF